VGLNRLYQVLDSLVYRHPLLFYGIHDTGRRDWPSLEPTGY
jgi:hypothetical protein